MGQPVSASVAAATLMAMLAAGALLGGCAQFDFPPLTLGQAANDRQGDAEVAQAESAADEAEVVAETDNAPDPVPSPSAKPTPGKLYDWSGDGRSVTRIVIDTDEQRARFYSGEDQIGWTTIASGVATHPTPRGEFTILEKVKNKRSNLYGKIVHRTGGVIKGSATGKDPVPAGARFVGASMPHFMRMTYDGIGMHAGPIPRPGSPASHGCIRMPKTLAATLYDHVAPGTAVTVIGNGPDYGNYGQRIAREQAEARARRAAAAAAAAEEAIALDALDAEVDVMREAEASAGTAAIAAMPGAAGSEQDRKPGRPEPARAVSSGTAGNQVIGSDAVPEHNAVAGASPSDSTDTGPSRLTPSQPAVTPIEDPVTVPRATRPPDPESATASDPAQQNPPAADPSQTRTQAPSTESGPSDLPPPVQAPPAQPIITPQAPMAPRYRSPPPPPVRSAALAPRLGRTSTRC